MAPGDIVLTPNWCWHGHGNEGTARAYWLDVLDVPLVHLLEPMFFDQYPGGVEAGIPITESSPFIYSQKEIQSRLNEGSLDPSGRHGTQIELGHPALDTLSIFMMRLSPGIETRPYKTTANTLYAVVEGEGETLVEANSFSWNRGDGDRSSRLVEAFS